MNKARESDKTLTTYDTQNIIPLLKSENPDLRKVYSKVLQMVNYTLHSNIASLAALKRNGRNVGHLRFKGKNWYNTLNYNQSGFKLDQDHGILKLSTVGEIKRLDKRWFAIVQAEHETEPLPQTGNAVGLDVGLNSFVVDSDGNSVENPRFAEKAAAKAKNIQRRLSRAKKAPIIARNSKISWIKLMRESITRDLISFTSFPGCTSTNTISSALKIWMSKG